MAGLKAISLEKSLKSIESTERSGSVQQLSPVNLEQGAWVNFQYNGRVGQRAGKAGLSGSLASQRSCVGAVHVAVVSEVEAGPAPHLLRSVGLPQ